MSEFKKDGNEYDDLREYKDGDYVLYSEAQAAIAERDQVILAGRPDE